MHVTMSDPVICSNILRLITNQCRHVAPIMVGGPEAELREPLLETESQVLTSLNPCRVEDA